MHLNTTYLTNFLIMGFFPYLLFLSFLLASSTVFSDLSAERSGLLTLRSAVGGRTMYWNVTQQDPCKWAGVQCDDAHSQVLALRLPGVALTGTLPSGIFSNLPHLRTLSLRLNSLKGNLPSDISSCTSLRNLYLQGNQLDGGIPDSIFSLKDLVRLNLAQNMFSGPISDQFNDLVRLRTLYLEDNSLNGTIPDLAALVKLEQFNVSNNNGLVGSVPKSLTSKPKSSFLSTQLCGAPLDNCPTNGTAPSPSGEAGGANGEGNGNGKKKSKLSGGAIAGIVIGCVLGFVILLVLFMLCCRKRGRKKTRSVDIASLKHLEADPPTGEKSLSEAGTGNGGYSVAAAAAAAMSANGNVRTEVGGGGGSVGAKKLVFFGNASKVFDLEDLLRASAEVLGKGTFGTAYKAVLEMGTVAAVKRLKDVTISETEFREKIEVVGAMDHENLVPLRAYYFSRDEKLLVYDYMSMGSLSALLHGNKGSGRTPLNWEIRTGIALGAARGIMYLHSQGPQISHGNIKSSNILLTKTYDARVSDFGLAHLVGPSSTPNRVAGYRAPEVTDPRKVSQKADVYSFGVLLLELLTGKAPTHALLNEEGVDLPRWVQSVVREEWTSEVFDLELLRYQNIEEDMVLLLQLAVDCAAQYPDNRPSMPEVTSRIEEIRRSSIQEYRDPVPDQVQDDDDGSYQHPQP